MFKSPNVSDSIFLASGDKNYSFAEEVAQFLSIGIPVIKIDSEKYADGEYNIFVPQLSRRCENVFLFHSFSPSVNDKFVEFLLLADALRTAGAQNIIAVIPYLSYARQDRPFNRSGLRESVVIEEDFLGGKEFAPLSSRVICSSIGRIIDNVFIFECHSMQICGFFGVPAHNIDLSSESVSKVIGDMIDMSSTDIAIVAPDAGAFKRAFSIADGLKEMEHKSISAFVLNKKRRSPGSCELFESFGDFRGKACFIVDDIIDSGGTICNAASYLKSKGAFLVVAIISHGVLSGKGYQNIESCSDLDFLYVGNSIPVVNNNDSKIKTFSICGDVARAIVDSGCINL